MKDLKCQQRVLITHIFLFRHKMIIKCVLYQENFLKCDTLCKVEHEIAYRHSDIYMCILIYDTFFKCKKVKHISK